MLELNVGPSPQQLRLLARALDISKEKLWQEKASRINRLQVTANLTKLPNILDSHENLRCMQRIKSSLASVKPSPASK
jgi:hypothetical protein